MKRRAVVRWCIVLTALCAALWGVPHLLARMGLVDPGQEDLFGALTDLFDAAPAIEEAEADRDNFTVISPNGAKLSPEERERLETSARAAAPDREPASVRKAARRSAPPTPVRRPR